MKTKRTLTITAIGLAMLVLATLVFMRQTQPVKAQSEQPPPTQDRVSFGVVGITAGQTVRISVANTILPNDVNLPPGPTRVVMTFRAMNGQLVRNRSGEVIRRTIDLERGDSAFLDLDYDQLPPSPIRAQVRAVVTIVPPPGGDNNALQDGVCVPNVEVINNANGRTQFVLSGSPSIRAFIPLES